MAEVPRTDEWLSPAEAATAGGLRYLKRRNEWKLGRWTAKRAVSAYARLTGAALALVEVEVRPAASGAPNLFIQGLPVPMSISISHSADVAACVLVPEVVGLGCDLESVVPRSEAFVRTFFTRREQQLIADVPDDERPWCATLLWSAKESALKALHQGLRLDTRSIEVVPEHSNRVWHPLRAEHADSGQALHGWWRSYGPFVLTTAALQELRLPVRLHRHAPVAGTVSLLGGGRDSA